LRSNLEFIVRFHSWMGLRNGCANLFV